MKSQNAIEDIDSGPCSFIKWCSAGRGAGLGPGVVAGGSCPGLQLSSVSVEKVWRGGTLCSKHIFTSLQFASALLSSHNWWNGSVLYRKQPTHSCEGILSCVSASSCHHFLNMGIWAKCHFDERVQYPKELCAETEYRLLKQLEYLDMEGLLDAVHAISKVTKAACYFYCIAKAYYLSNISYNL